MGQDHINNVAALESHGIDERARLALGERDLMGFVKARQAELQRQENDFLSPFSLQIGTAEASDEDIDVDDE